MSIISQLMLIQILIYVNPHLNAGGIQEGVLFLTTFKYIKIGNFNFLWTEKMCMVVFFGHPVFVDDGVNN